MNHFPDRPALNYCGQTWTYLQLNKEVDRFARHLVGWGVSKDSHVGLLCNTEPKALIAMLALNRIGALTVMLNTSYSHYELEKVLDLSDTEFLLLGDGYKGVNFPELCYDLDVKKAYIGLGGFAPGYEPLESFPEVDQTVVAEMAGKVQPEDNAFMLFTSGTTSWPKGVLGSQFSRANSGIQQGMDLEMTEQDRVLVAMPMFHCFSLSVNIMATLFYGACLYFPKTRHTAEIVSKLEQERITLFSCVPALFRAILMKDDLSKRNLCIRTGFIGGSSYSPKLFCEIEKKFGMTLLSSLGQTEATAGITTSNITDSLEIRSTTIGHAMNHVELTIRQNGEEVPEGQLGEVCVRGYVVMSGYYKNPKATSAVIDQDGWLHTGDIGFIKDNYITLTGRLKDLIIRGGENISAKEIEAVLEKDERVWDCKAVGVPDEHWGEEVAICVVLNEGVTLTEEDIRKLYEETVAYYKVPKYIMFFDRLPRSSAGKVKIGELRDMISSKL